MIQLRRRAIVPLRTNGGRHPSILLTDPLKRPGRGRAEVLVVHLTSSPKNYDPTCVSGKDEDRRIMPGSYVLYSRLRIMKLEDVEQEIRRYNRTVKRIGPDAFQRIIEGLFRSGAFTEEFRDFYLQAQRQGKAD